MASLEKPSGKRVNCSADMFRTLEIYAASESAAAGLASWFCAKFETEHVRRDASKYGTSDEYGNGTKTRGDGDPPPRP
ncbi:hypothetical protein, partial [Burkholderia multivorans]|uniref:hypothetical protein n=1 Tax=Burkholderia multivorans TaxID=87883 RepID=UPI00286FC219